MNGAVLGLDLGGTVVKAGVVSPEGAVHSLVTQPSGESGGVAAWASAALAAAEDAVTQSSVQPLAIGLSVPGAVDPRTGRLVDLVDRLPTERGLNLADEFSRLGLPVVADNDARAALAAEQRWGGPDRCGDLVVLTIGTGIGGAADIAGRAPGGDPVLAGNQLGHLTIEFDGRRCVCGNLGCAETVASGTALVVAAREAGLDVEDAPGVFAAEATGDRRATEVVDRFVAGLVATLVNAIHAYQPQLIVLTGGVLAGADRFLPRIRADVAERAWTLPRGRVRIDVSRFGRCAGVLAGAAVALGQEREGPPGK